MPGKLLCALHGHSPSPTPNLALHVGTPDIYKNTSASRDVRCPQWKREIGGNRSSYAENDEGCFIIEAIGEPMSRVFFFYATRSIKSFGRLVNHGLPCEANIKPHIPVKIDGEWRIGFYALKDIHEGEEPLYDYGKQPTQFKKMEFHWSYR